MNEDKYVSKDYTLHILIGIVGTLIIILGGFYVNVNAADQARQDQQISATVSQTAVMARNIVRLCQANHINCEQ